MAQQVRTKQIVVDAGRCLGCRSCELACGKAHAGFDDIVEAVLSDAILVSRVYVVAAEGGAAPVQCRHCRKAPCVAVCPTDALQKDEDDGLVRLDPEKCVGCLACVIVCPFGAIEYHDASETVVKCDLCEGIIEAGEEPHCVAACPTGALRIAGLDESREPRHDIAARKDTGVSRADQETESR